MLLESSSVDPILPKFEAELVVQSRLEKWL
jgi:hypothetical protein